jgi:hypothetical protein
MLEAAMLATIIVAGVNVTLEDPAFLDALHATGPLPAYAERMKLYNPLLGDWAVEVVDYDADGSRHTGQGEWHFAWVLEGRAIQDVWIAPPRDRRAPGQSLQGNRYGTTLRVYDAEKDVWHVTWINPVTGIRNQLIGRRQGSEIVHEGTDTDGSLMRWVFSDITRHSFRWRGEVSSDGGKTWRLSAEFFGRRVPGPDSSYR